MPERFKPQQTMFPLLSGDGRLAGWSAEAPHFEGTLLRHAEAERKIGTPIVIVPALLLVEAHMLTAGGVPSAGGMWVLAIANVNCLRRMPVVIRRA